MESSVLVCDLSVVLVLIVFDTFLLRSNINCCFPLQNDDENSYVIQKLRISLIIWFFLFF